MQGKEFNSSEIEFNLNAIYSYIYQGVQGVKKSSDYFVGILKDSNNPDYDYACYFLKKVDWFLMYLTELMSAILPLSCVAVP